MIFEFLDNININEEILDENIPRDLLQAYKRSSAYDSLNQAQKDLLETMTTK